MNKATANLTAHLFIDCPKCKHGFDLFDNDDDGIYSMPIFNNTWRDLEDEDVICPECDHEFKIKNIEY